MTNCTSATVGIPYAYHITAYEVQCPVCGEIVTLMKPKDFESFLTDEYATHYEQTHGR